ncbi:hypothetical protein pVco7_gp121 [Vibrio phage pVco-7]|uniref:Uncharacterized protein n=1 Tax=Vibrio phage pVco-5 TaxID=1965485 RepID=A0A1W6JV26_9CAUD|nr:hypothetical protein KNT61_gp122 [Vibrio phage pVco-5]ARM71110.1 hypothetical protein pVco5_121 [Vibrio phage pVco-5]
MDIAQWLAHPLVVSLIVAFVVGVAGWFVLLKQLEIRQTTSEKTVEELKEHVAEKFTEVDKRFILLEEVTKDNKDIQNKILIQLHVIENEVKHLQKP